MHVGAATGFPVGQTAHLSAKSLTPKDAIEKGADEIDYVMNVAEVKKQKFRVHKRRDGADRGCLQEGRGHQQSDL